MAGLWGQVNVSCGCCLDFWAPGQPVPEHYARARWYYCCVGCCAATSAISRHGRTGGRSLRRWASHRSNCWIMSPPRSRCEPSSSISSLSTSAFRTTGLLSKILTAHARDPPVRGQSICLLARSPLSRSCVGVSARQCALRRTTSATTARGTRDRRCCQRSRRRAGSSPWTSCSLKVRQLLSSGFEFLFVGMAARMVVLCPLHPTARASICWRWVSAQTTC